MNKYSKFLNVEEGTISFAIRKNKIKWNDGLIHPIMNLSNFTSDSARGSVLILKDSDNKLKFFHVFLDKGRTDVETDVSKLSVNEDHIFIFTWSVETKEIIIFIDAIKVGISKIKY